MYKNIEELRYVANIELEALEVEIRCLLDEYYKKPYELDFRVKSRNGILRKQEKYKMNNITKIPDIIGFRICLYDEADCEKVSNIIREYFKPIHVKDTFNKTKSFGFKAFIHYLFDRKINTEIQVMTTEMRDWINMNQTIYETSHYGQTLVRKYNTQFV